MDQLRADRDAERDEYNKHIEELERMLNLKEPMPVPAAPPAPKRPKLIAMPAAPKAKSEMQEAPLQKGESA